ncbi:MAG: arginine--tRNA ligase [Kiritimatiellia bacterium]
MKSVSETLSEWMQAAFAAAFPENKSEIGEISVIPSTRPEFGDFQCNSAMRLARVLKTAPREIAGRIIKHAPAAEGVARTEHAGPGFINIFLDDKWITKRVETVLSDERLGTDRPGAGRTVVMDYGSPNITKPLHIGHLRSHNIGSALDRLYRFLGYRVIADNHLGDWGTQFGITISGYRRFGDEEAMKKSPMEELERVYIKSYELSRKDPEWLDKCREELVKLQNQDPETTRLWHRFVDLSKRELQRIYERLGVSYDLIRGESYYKEKLEGTVNRLVEKGIAVRSEGALVVFLENEKLPVCIVRKKDGAFNYATTDLAAVADRVEEFSPDRIVYVTDERQQLHFNQVFAISRKLGCTTRLEHVWFGLMRLPEGTFSTREGTTIPLEVLLDEAESRAFDIVKETSPELDEHRQREIARAVGTGAVKYADLSQNPQSVVTFTWDKALALDGNSGPYLQYAYARIKSVRDKYNERFSGSDPLAFPLSLSEPVERKLALKLLLFPEITVRAAESYKPSMIADYLYELTQTYNSFYQNVPFLKADDGVRESRVKLCAAVAAVLGKGLELLGLETLDRI